MVIQDERCPWNVPVRVERGGFVPLFPEHEELNVRVAPHPAFESQDQGYPAGSLLFADLQTNPYANVSGRLGSGRAGFYRDWYLKGVGRTPLAANWNRKDHLHNSGHLAASSAIREYLASRYLAGEGCDGSIVACEGVLLAELEPTLRDYHRILYGNRPAENVPLVDRHLQAITVKRGGFARQSNFLWLLHHLSPAYIDQGRVGLGTFCELFSAALTPPGEQDLAPAESTPEALAGLLGRSVQVACERFRLWFSRGVWWGSFANNFTIDGRFLDLETPALFGSPCFGYLSSVGGAGSTMKDVKSSIIGTELFSFLAQTRVFCLSLVRILTGLTGWFSAIEREFAAALAAEVEQQLLAPEQIIGSRDQTLEWVTEMLEETLGRLPDADRTLVRRLVEYLYDRELGEDALEVENTAEDARFVAVAGIPGMITEPGLRLNLYALALQSGRTLGPTGEQCRKGRVLAELMADLDQTTSLPTLLDKLRALPASI